MNQMHIGAIGMDSDSGAPIVLLQDEDKRRALPIWVGMSEARAISLALSKTNAPRPLTHNLMLDAVNSLGYVVKNVEINGLAEGVFKATIALHHEDYADGKPPIYLDSRPSDALALAAISGVPVFVSEEIYTKASISIKSEDDEKEDLAFKDFLKNLKASDFNGKVQ